MLSRGAGYFKTPDNSGENGLVKQLGGSFHEVNPLFRVSVLFLISGVTVYPIIPFLFIKLSDCLSNYLSYCLAQVNAAQLRALFRSDS